MQAWVLVLLLERLSASYAYLNTEHLSCTFQGKYNYVMNSIEATISRVISKIDDVEDILSDILPKTDKKHKEEILDICSLLRQRV